MTEKVHPPPWQERGVLDPPRVKRSVAPKEDEPVLHRVLTNSTRQAGPALPLYSGGTSQARNSSNSHPVFGVHVRTTIDSYNRFVLHEWKSELDR